MPGCVVNVYDIDDEGTLKEEILDQRLDELLDVIFATHQATEEGKGSSFDVEKHHELARKAAEEAAREQIMGLCKVQMSVPV